MQTDITKIIHRITPLWRIGIYVSILFGLVLLSGTSWVIVENLQNGIRAAELPMILFQVFGVAFYGLGIFICISSLQIFVVTSPLGLEYHGIGIRVFTTWENIAQVRLVGIAARLGIGAEVIKLRQPPQILWSNWFGRKLFEYQEGIPLLDFGKWRSSQLGSEIRKYVPELLV